MIGFIIGLFVGAVIAFFVLALMMASREDDEHDSKR